MMEASQPVVLVVDDDRSSRNVMSRTVSSAGWSVEAFASGSEFLDSYQPDRPGCILLDVRMPGMSGLSVQQRLGEKGPHPPVVLISGYSDTAAVVRGMKAGAIDFLEKPFSSQQLLAAVEEAIERDAFERRSRDRSMDARRRLDALTRREREVALLVAQGRLNKQVAGDLGISQRTVEVHRQKLMRKLGADSVADLVRIVVDAETQ